VLTSLHIPVSFAICFVNALYLGGAIYFTIKIFRATVAPVHLVILIIMNWITVKLFVLPLSEMQFLFFSMGSLWYFHHYTLTKKPLNLLISAVFCAISIFTRSAGVALLAALLISFLLVNRHQVIEWIRSQRIYFIVVLTVIVISLYWLFSSPKFLIYLDFLVSPLAKDPLSFIGSNLFHHLINWGELFINIPYSKAGGLLSQQAAGPIYFFTGLFALLLMLRLLFKRNANIPGYLKVYFLLYLLLIFCWPYFEARFYIPVLPLTGAIILQNINVRPFFKKLFSFYGFLYLLMGLAALEYYTKMSFNKKELALKQEEGLFRKEYEKHFFNQQPADSVINRKALYILEKYD
jgi:hypothetical protein